MTDSPPDEQPPSPRAAVASRGLLTSAGALVASRLVVAVLGWAGTILIVRALTPREWGQFSLIFTVLAMFSFMTSLGSSRIVLAELARAGVQAGPYAGTYVVLRLLLGAVAYASAVGFVTIAGYPSEVITGTALAGIILVIAAGGAGLDVVFQSEFKMGITATATVLGQLAQLALTVLVALTSPGLLLFVLPAIAFDVVAAAWKVYKVRRVFPLRLHVDVAAWKSILLQAAPLAAGGAFATIALSADLIILSKVDDFAAVGALAVADKFVMVVAFIPMAVEPPLVALLVRSWPANVTAFYQTVRRGMLLMSVTAGLVLVSFLPVAADVMVVLYGSEYRDAATAAQLSVFAGCLQFYSYMILGALVAMGRNRDFLLFNLAALVTTVAASLVLIPVYSVLGAGLARTASALLMLVVLALLVRRRLTGAVLEGRQHLIVGACCATALLVGTLTADVLWWPIAAGLGVFTYLGLLHRSKATGPFGLRSLADDERALISPVAGGPVPPQVADPAGS